MWKMLRKLLVCFALPLLATSFVIGTNQDRNQELGEPGKVSKTIKEDYPQNTANNNPNGCDKEKNPGVTWETFCDQRGLKCLYETSAQILQCVCHSYPNCEELCPDLVDEKGMESSDKCINSAKDDTCMVTCKDGFKLKDGKTTDTVTCQDGGQWNRDPKCYPSCSELKKEGMRLSGDCQLPFEGAKCSVSCELGFYLKEGQARATADTVTTVCTRNGKWDKDLQCVGQGKDHVAQDCAEHFKSGERISGVYSIRPLGWEKSFYVFCDMNTAGGGWTVFQRRGDFGNPEDYFYRSWTDYKNGFGDLTREFWLGLDRIAALTQQSGNALRVELTAMNGDRRYANYNWFWVDKEDKEYKLAITGFSGNSGDGMAYHNTQTFSTKDKGKYSASAQQYKGAWWYTTGHVSNLNGLNLKGVTQSYADSITWHPFRGHYYSLYSEMKIRPTTF